MQLHLKSAGLRSVVSGVVPIGVWAATIVCAVFMAVIPACTTTQNFGKEHGDSPHPSRPSADAPVDSLQNSDITASYQMVPTTPVSPEDKRAVTVFIPSEAATGNPIEVKVEITNFDAAARDFKVYVHFLSMLEHGYIFESVLGELQPPTTQLITIAPGATEAVVVATPWQKIKPVLESTALIVTDVAVTRTNDNRRWSARNKMTRVLGLPIQITLDRVGTAFVGTTIAATVTYQNPSDESFANGIIDLKGVNDLLIGQGEENWAEEETIELGTVAPREEGVIKRTLIARGTCDHYLFGRIRADQTVRSESSASIFVVQCPDFNGDGIVGWIDVAIVLGCIAYPDREPEFQRKVLYTLDRYRGGTVDLRDFASFLTLLGRTCP